MDLPDKAAAPSPAPPSKPGNVHLERFQYDVARELGLSPTALSQILGQPGWQADLERRTHSSKKRAPRR